MPTYEYYCTACEQTMEVFQSMKDDPLKVCPECNKKGKIKRLVSGGAGIIFKGSGFYETDYKRSNPSGKSGGDSAPKKEKSSEGKTAASD